MRKNSPKGSAVGREVIGGNQGADHGEQGVAVEQLSIRGLPISCAEYEGDGCVQHRISPITLRELVGAEITLQIEKVDAVQKRDGYFDGLDRPPALCDMDHIVEHRSQHSWIQLRVRESMPG
jgi:hypothetical protein